MRVIIDRFEGDFVVVELENKLFANIPKSLVPQGAKEGCVLSIELDEEETEKWKQNISELIDKITDLEDDVPVAKTDRELSVHNNTLQSNQNPRI